VVRAGRVVETAQPCLRMPADGPVKPAIRPV
jgi:hypothetical protein